LALAGRFGLELYIMHIPSLSGDAELERLFTELSPQCIVLLEDIDTAGMKRKSQDEAEQAERERKLRGAPQSGHCTLSGLLNVLDGVASQEGRIVLMTSNAAADLDEALVRPGRIDIKIYMGHIDGDAAEEMFLRMYEPDENDEPNSAETCARLEPELLHKLAKDFGARLMPGVFTPAQLQGFLLVHRGQPEAALAQFGSWMQAEKLKMESLEAQKQKERKEQKAKQQLAESAALAETTNHETRTNTDATGPSQT
jgi:mitochondrial chaperone BCS1